MSLCGTKATGPYFSKLNKICTARAGPKKFVSKMFTINFASKSQLF